MPIYPYKCFKCGERFDLHRSMDKVEDEANCPKCGSSKTMLVFTPACIGGRAGQFCSKSAGWRYT